MKELTEEQEYIKSVEDHCKAMGLTNIYSILLTGEFVLNEENYCKGNLPRSQEGFRNGNGEGVWIQPFSESDQEIYDTNITGDSFQAILLNDSIYYPFPYGTLLYFKNYGTEVRPVLDYEWFDGVVQENSDNTLEKMLEKNNE